MAACPTHLSGLGLQSRHSGALVFSQQQGVLYPAERSEADQPRPISRSVVIGLHELQAEQVAVPAIYLL